jgi:hypothetical protein
MFSEKLNTIDLIKISHEKLYSIYKTLNDDLKALHHYKKYILFRDSLFNENNTRKEVELEMKYKFEKQEYADKSLQQRKEEEAVLQSKRQNIQLLLASVVLLIALFFSIYIYKNFKEKKRANDEILLQKNLIEEKQKEIIDSILYARKIQTALITSERNFARFLKIAK